MKSIVIKKILRSAAVLLCGTGLMLSAAVAQQDTTQTAPNEQQQAMPQGGRHGWSPERRAEMLQRRLGLSEEQTTQIESILVDSRTKMEGVRADTSLSEQDRRSQFLALRQEQEAKIRAALTPDQQTQYDAMQARHRAYRGGAPQDAAPQTPQAY